MVYGNTEVVPVYYCTFTLASITGGALVFNEFSHLSAAQAGMFASGCVLAGLGVGLLPSNREAARRFQALEPDHKAEALRKENSFSDSGRSPHPLGGVYTASLLQARATHLHATDPERFSRSVAEANYAPTLAAARLHNKLMRIRHRSSSIAPTAETTEAAEMGGELPPEVAAALEAGTPLSRFEMVVGEMSRGTQQRIVLKRAGDGQGKWRIALQPVRETDGQQLSEVTNDARE